MSSVVADTHAIIWFLLDSPRLSATARAAMDGALESGDLIHVSAISVVEATYLVEKGSVDEPAFQQLLQALADPSQGIRAVPVDLAVARSVRRIERKAVPDMPDRIIGATALHLGLPLVSRDSMLRQSGIEVIW